MTQKIDTVVFDLGGVLVDWNPRYLYRKLIADEKEMEHFLAHVCNGEWNELHDSGHPIAQGTRELIARFPEKEKLIRDFFGRWPEMVAGEVSGTAEVLAEIRRQQRHKIYALSNWSAETFPHAKRRFEFFEHFDEVLLSGQEKMMKPDPRFFALLTSRHGVAPERSVFIDDVEKNVAAARSLGFHSIRFTDSASLRQKLAEIGVLSE